MEERKRKHLSEIKESAWSKRLRAETSTDEDEEDISVFLPDTRNSREWSNATYSGSVKNLRRVTPKPVSGSANGLRRSTRIRVPPLETWRNERLVFKTSTSGEVECLGIEKGTPADNSSLLQMERKRERIELKKKRTVERGRSLRKKSTNVRDTEADLLVPAKVHRAFDSLRWRFPPSEIRPPPYRFAKSFSSSSIRFGFLELSPFGKKEERYSPDHNSHFTVIKGHLEVTIEDRRFLFNVGDSFIVPSGVPYSITNCTRFKSLLAFCDFTMPFFTDP
ncbi:CENP-C_C domain-containing protein [Trichonephila clavata]|uniref:CENP-C_C domain-containing protein n=1 Tax=Trichonephila clavata TaxID=2740835 RepID=A0A8X6KCF1_TRICU|nr:CENP-C_C domain-containing protein [Trichonephila clavata]